MTQGGFGGSAWGGGPWGGAGAHFDTSVDTVETVTVSEGLAVNVPMHLLSAVPVSLTLVDLTFSSPLDVTYGPLTSPSNYSIPSLNVLGAGFGPSSNVIRLHTDFQAPITYTVTVALARSASTDTLDPSFNSVTFTGLSASPAFFAAGQGLRKVMLTFSQTMLQNAALTNPSNYSLQDLNGNTIPILAVTPTGNAPISRVTLTLGSNLVRWGYYAAHVNSNVKTLTGLSVFPDTNVFQWEDNSAAVTRGPIVVPIKDFSGEVSGGLHGSPAGQVFFSPALTSSAANSVIQVEEVSVCTRAYDVYSFPNPPDPVPFFTYGNGAPAGALGSLSTVLWAPAEKLGQARVVLGDVRSDTVPEPLDAVTSVILTEPIKTSIGGFLNDARWHVYSGVATTFTVANNLAPVGAGPTVAVIYPTDAAQAVDATTTITSYVRSSSDSVSVSDKALLSTSRSLADSLSISDSVTATLS